MEDPIDPSPPDPTDLDIKLAPITWSEAEAAELFVLLSDFETVKFTNWPHAPTRGECDERVAKMRVRYGGASAHFGPFAIRATEGRFLGLVGADARDGTPSQGEYEVWYALRRDAWGRSVGTQALGALLRTMSTSGRARSAIATAVTTNIASWRMLERHGFERQGVIAAGHTKHGLALDLYSYRRLIVPVGSG